MFCIATPRFPRLPPFFLRKNLLIPSFSQLSRGPTPTPSFVKGGVTNYKVTYLMIGANTTKTFQENSKE